VSERGAGGFVGYCMVKFRLGLVPPDVLYSLLPLTLYFDTYIHCVCFHVFRCVLFLVLCSFVIPTLLFLTFVFQSLLCFFSFSTLDH
jgi:hypothetical protein